MAFPLVPLPPRGAADERCGVLLQVADEDVVARPGASGSRLVGVRVKATEPTVPGDRRLEVRVVSLAAARRPVARLTSVVVSACRSRRRCRSTGPCRPGPGWRQFEANATELPSAESDGSAEPVAVSLAPLAPVARLTSVVVLSCRSRTKTSMLSSASSGSRLEAFEEKATTVRRRDRREIGGPVALRAAGARWPCSPASSCCPAGRGRRRPMSYPHRPGRGSPNQT